MEKKHGFTPKYTNVQAPTATMNIHQHSRCHYKQNSGSTPAGTNNPPHWRACGATRPQVARRRLLRQQRQRPPLRAASSSYDLRADAAATRSSPTSPLEGRGQAIKAKEPEARSADGSGDLVGDEDFSDHLSTGRSPLKSSRTGKHRPRAKVSRRSKGTIAQEHERRPSSARRLRRSPGVHGATTARAAGR
jgi:hypothetical protein